MIELQTMEAEASRISPSPSFSSYSSETLAEIAARVIDELRRDPHSVTDDETLFESWDNDNFAAQPHDHHRHHPIGNDDVGANTNANADDDDDDFEFALSRDPNSSPVSADDIFYNGQIRPMYPIFDRNLLFGNATYANTPGNDAVSAIPTGNNDTAATRRRRPPLRKLMFDERETGSCSSSTSEAEDNIELEGVAEGTYCVWTPKSGSATAEPMGKGRKKSNSTGSGSKRWNFLDLLLRSHSEGKKPILLQGPLKRTNKVAHEVAKHSSVENNGGGSVEQEGQYYVKNTGTRMVGTPKEGDQSKRKSFLPYRQELVGLFTNVNGLGRNLNPF